MIKCAKNRAVEIDCSLGIFQIFCFKVYFFAWDYAYDNRNLRLKEEASKEDWRYQIINDGVLISEFLVQLFIALGVEKTRYVLAGERGDWEENFYRFGMNIRKSLLLCRMRIFTNNPLTDQMEEKIEKFFFAG